MTSFAFEERYIDGEYVRHEFLCDRTEWVPQVVDRYDVEKAPTYVFLHGVQGWDGTLTTDHLRVQALWLDVDGDPRPLKGYKPITDMGRGVLRVAVIEIRAAR